MDNVTVCDPRVRNVKIAVLHTNLHVPGIGELGKTLNTMDTQYKFRDAKLTWDGAGLELSCKGRTVFIPSTNVVYMEFAPEALVVQDLPPMTSA